MWKHGLTRSLAPTGGGGLGRPGLVELFESPPTVTLLPTLLGCRGDGAYQRPKRLNSGEVGASVGFDDWTAVRAECDYDLVDGAAEGAGRTWG